MNYVLDTNLLIQYIRQSKVWDIVEDTYFKKVISNYAFISEVSVGEIGAFAIANRWKKAKLQQLAILLKTLNILPISPASIKRQYAQISVYSQNRHKSLRLPKEFSPRNMGKNDIWIAATAASESMPLLSTDRDFEHLDGVFLEFVYVDATDILGKG